MEPSSSPPSPDEHRYAVCFYQSSQRRYLFKNKLGSGTHAKTQLVWSLGEKAPRVRKAVRDLELIGDIRKEVDIDRLLHDADKLARARADGLEPRMALACGHDDLPPWLPGDFEQERKNEGIGYFELCNGGDAFEFADSYGGIDNERKPIGVPFVLIARCMHHLLQTLQYMYHYQDLHPIIHGDMLIRNVFLHWKDTSGEKALPDFYLGDFGESKVLEHSQFTSVYQIPTWDIENTSQVFTELLEEGRNKSWAEMEEEGELGPLEPLLAELTRLEEEYAAMKVNFKIDDVPMTLPDLSQAIQIARTAEEECAAAEPNWNFWYEHQSRLAMSVFDITSCLFPTAEAALEKVNGIKGGVPGPWYLVRLDAEHNIIEFGEQDLSGIRWKPERTPESSRASPVPEDPMQMSPSPEDAPMEMSQSPEDESMEEESPSPEDDNGEAGA